MPEERALEAVLPLAERAVYSENEMGLGRGVSCRLSVPPLLRALRAVLLPAPSPPPGALPAKRAAGPAPAGEAGTDAAA
jgi:hypothetical protein